MEMKQLKIFWHVNVNEKILKSDLLSYRLYGMNISVISFNQMVSKFCTTLKVAIGSMFYSKRKIKRKETFSYCYSDSLTFNCYQSFQVFVKIAKKTQQQK